VDKARATLADALGVDFREVIFTASATEANNLVLRGVVKGANNDQPVRVIVSAIEHESVLETARELEEEGVEVIYLPVDKNGVVDLETFKKALTPETVLVSIMYVNNETGVTQPIAEIGKIVQEFKKQRTNDSGNKPYPIFHTDAAQASQLFSCLPSELGVDCMTISGHKIYGPKGVGALFSQSAIKPFVSTLLSGGGQEFGLRSGTENVPAIAGFGKAMELAVKERSARKEYIEGKRDRFLKGLKKIYPKIQVNTGKNISSHILNLWIPGYAAEDLLMRLDLGGVAVSSGSACRSRSFMTSYVLQAMGLSPKRIRESIRVSFGSTTNQDIDMALDVFKKILRP
jgi:cysteine desulfurase